MTDKNNLKSAKDLSEAEALLQAFGRQVTIDESHPWYSTQSSWSNGNESWTKVSKAYDTSYAKPYKDRYITDQNVEKINQDLTADCKASCTLEQLSTIAPKTEVSTSSSRNTELDLNKISSDHFKPHNITSGIVGKLPIELVKKNLLSSIMSYNVVLIEGQTGTGKSTQFPFYVLEDCILVQKILPKIMVTQPRKIACRSLAHRVCQEHNWSLGSIVGFQVGLDKQANKETLLTYCTPGVLLQKIIAEGSLDEYTHIMIDEVHERDEDIDLLLMVIRKMMLGHKKFFRLVIMSATMDTGKLYNYFNVRLREENSKSLTPIICKISKPVNNIHQVSVTYLDNLLEPLQILTNLLPFFDLKEARCSLYLLELGVKTIVDIIPNDVMSGGKSASILVFLPGLSEIDAFHRLLKKEQEEFEIIPLHSCISISEQNKVFLPPAKGKKKIILSTNIAESSITVSDVGYIIDFCLTKVMTKDLITNFSCLTTVWSSKDQAVQRAGRTGRCCSGHVYRMVPQEFYRKLNQHSKPSIVISPLELTVLKIKRLDMGDVKSLLGITLDPPPLSEIEAAVLTLKQLGALSCETEDSSDGIVTEIGKIISFLPIDVRLGKLVLLGHVFNVLEDCVIIAACLSTNRSVVKYVYGNEFKSFEHKFLWANGSQCDITICRRVYLEFAELLSTRPERKVLTDWCESHFLDENKLLEVEALIRELKIRLDNIGIASLAQPNRVVDDERSELMLRVVLCGAFFPNYFVTKPIKEEAIREPFNEKTVCTSVTLDGFPQNKKVEEYFEEVDQQLSVVSKNYKSTAFLRKMFIEFKNPKRIATGSGYHLKPHRKIYNFSNRIHENVYDDVILAIRFASNSSLTVKEEDVHQSVASVGFQTKTIFTEKIKRLYGPTNPTKVEFESILQRCGQYYVRVEQNSINSVILNPDYKANPRWLLVAATVNESQNGGLIVRDCSLMPNISGLASMMALLFAQSYKFKQNTKMNCVGGATFGVGWNKDGLSYHAESECDMSFDVLMTEIDFDMINKCRKIMRELIVTAYNVSDVSAPMIQKQEMLIELVGALLNRPRLTIQDVQVEKLSKVNATQRIQDESFYSIVKPRKSDLLSCFKAIQRNLIQLRSIELNEIFPPKEGAFCLLCGSGYKNRLIFTNDVVNHLNNSKHQERFKQWTSKCKINESDDSDDNDGDDFQNSRN